MKKLLMSCLACSTLFTVSTWAAESTERRIEEIVVTAERRESTVSDTSISITAFTSEFLEDFGIRNQEDLQNYIPAAVIEPYDMTIRGVGRNFRSLGGDPGVATYLNGVYSEDFGIASTEGGLYDIERIEVLRGPQGTLYGRNAIGGAINFINNKPTDEIEGELRTVFGDNDLQEYYGMISGPLIRDVSLRAPPPSPASAMVTSRSWVLSGATPTITAMRTTRWLCASRQPSGSSSMSAATSEVIQG